MFVSKIVTRLLHYDYVICGGASTGLGLANKIVKRIISAQCKNLTDKKLLLIEKNKGLDIYKKHNFPNTINRVLCTNPRTVQLFEDLGIWDDLKKNAAYPSSHIEIWDEYTGVLEFKPIRKDYSICYMVDNTVLQTLLYKRFLDYVSLKKHDIKLNTSIQAIRYFKDSGKDRIELVLTDNTHVTTDLLIGCDGAMSHVRELAGISTWKHNYNMSLLVGTANYLSDVCGECTFQKFTSNGYIAFLPLGSGYCSYAWCVNDPEGDNLNKLDSYQLACVMNNYLAKKCEMPFIYSYSKNLLDYFIMGWKPGKHGSNMSKFNYRPLHVKSIVEESRYYFPLKIIFAKQFVKNNIVLVGDAAHRINPITAQGLNLGYKDVIELVNILEKTHQMGFGNFHPMLLANYDKYRKLDVAMHVGFGTITNYAYANDIKFLTFLRSFGLSLANIFPFKNEIVHKITC